MIKGIQSLKDKFSKREDDLLDYIEFEPEMMTTSVDGENLSIRVSTGDSLNNTKNFKINISKAVEYYLEFSGFNSYVDKVYVEGTVNLVIKSEEGTTSKILAEHKIEVSPYDSGEMPPIEDVSQEIKDLWQTTYIESMDDLNADQSDSRPSSNGIKRSGKKPRKISWSVLLIIVLLFLSAVMFLTTRFSDSEKPNDSDQVITGMLDEIAIQQNNEKNSKSESQSVEDEVLETFNLEKGINLDQ